MEIKFFWNGSFVGTNHHMKVNGKEISLGGVVSSEEEAIEEAIKILKKDYNIIMEPDNIKFEWGGCL
jgi:hypothetical protein